MTRESKTVLTIHEMDVRHITLTVLLGYLVPENNHRH